MKKISLVLMMVLFGISFALAQRTITGLVTDKKGEALIGASVLIKNTSVGMVTDVDGRYNIAVPAGATTLVFTFVGYETLDVKIGSSNTIDVQLEEDSKVLAGVVIVETGTGVATDKRKVSTDVQTIGARALPPTPTASIDQALVGKIAGAQISSINGTPGAKASILLRGINTLNRGTNPMIMMDGVELGATDLNAIGLASIDRVEVVQGAAAASIYGAQGANGVIQLFSKRGKKDDLNIEFSSSYVNSSYLNVGGLRKADLHGFETDASNNVVGGTKNPLTWDPALGTYSENLIWNSTSPTLKINKPYDKNLKYIDHFKMFLQDAPTTNNHLSISGGKGPVDFAIGLGQNTQESNFIGNGNFKRTNLNANIGIDLAKGLTLRSTTQLIHTRSTINDGGGNATIFALFNTRPFIDYTAKMTDGNYPAFLGNAQGVNGTNPFYINQYAKSLQKTNDLVQSLNLTYAPFKVLEFSAKYGLNYQNKDNQYTYGNQNGNVNQLETGYYWAGGYGDGGGEIQNFIYSTTFQNLMTSAILKLDAKKDLGINLPITSSTQVAYDYRNRQYRKYGAVGVGLPTYLPTTIKQAASQQIIDENSEPFITFGYLVNQNFDFGEVAGVTAGFRSDYSSAFGGGSKAFTFPHASGYFRPSSLAFWQKSALGKIMPEVKLRAAYGQAGIQPKPFDRYITLGTKTVGSTNALYLPQAQSNPDLGVEVSTEQEFGADITLAGSKGDWFSSIIFSPTYWNRTTDNAIYDVASAPSTGVFTKKDNAFGLASNGFQFSLGAKILSNKDFEWSFTANYTRQSSTITKVQGQEVVVTSAAGSTGYVLKAGEKVGQIFGFLGLHSLTEQRDGKFLLPQDQVGQYEVASNGWVVHKATKVPYFTPDQYSFGDPNPLFNMAFINSITYKKFLTLNFQFDWIQGSHIYNQTKEWMYRDGIHSDYQQPFTINGETGAWSAFYRGVYAERSRNGTKNYFYEDASFVRLRNLELVVDLAKIVTVPYCKTLQMTIGGRNLLTWTKYTGLDPEVNSSNVYEKGEASAWDRGTDHNTMPNLRSYQLGFRVGF